MEFPLFSAHGDLDYSSLSGKRVRFRSMGVALRPDGSMPYLSHTDGILELPGGGIDPGESPDQAFLRELEEEIGVMPLSPPEPLGVALTGSSELYRYFQSHL